MLMESCLAGCSGLNVSSLEQIDYVEKTVDEENGLRILLIKKEKV
jgi:hypothetical protein